MKIEISFKDDEARAIRSYLAQRYGKRKDTNLATLAKIAIRQEVAMEAKKELDEAREKV